MAVNVETAIKYMESLKARNIRYSMTGSRTGADGTGDCSGTIYQGLLNAGMPSAGWVLNTDSMHSWLEKNDWKQIANQTEWAAKRGDITIFGRRGASGGAAGHVVLWISNSQFIHCTWNSEWDHGVRVDYETNKLFLYDMMWYTYRYNGATDNKPVAPVKPQPPKPTGSIKQKGTFVNGDTAIQVRVGSAGLNATKGGMLPAFASVIYNGTSVKDGYEWVHYIGYSGDKLFLPVKPVGKSLWGTIK